MRLGGDLLVGDRLGDLLLVDLLVWLEIGRSLSVEEIWNASGEVSLLFCYVLGKESFWFGLPGVLAPDPSGVGFVPRLTTFAVEPCGSGC